MTGSGKLFAAVVALTIMGAACSGSGETEPPTGADDGSAQGELQPGRGAEAGEPQQESGSTETTQSYVFMAETDTSLAMIEMTVGPGGQIDGRHEFVRFADDGDPFSEEEMFGGMFADNQFELTGLSDTRSAYIGTLDGDGDTLTLDGTFGVSATEWRRIGSADEFDEAVGEHDAAPVECEEEGAFGCGEG